jgi:hypothetical protein
MNLSITHTVYSHTLKTINGISLGNAENNSALHKTVQLPQKSDIFIISM